MIYSSLINEWSESYLLCRAARADACETTLKRRLAALGKYAFTSTMTSEDRTHTFSLSLQSPWGEQLEVQRILNANDLPSL